MVQTIGTCNILIVVLAYITILSKADFNPFSDEELYSIHWAGPTDLDKIQAKGNVEIVSVQTEENERYHCVLPESQASIDATRKSTYNGATPDELMETLFSQSACSYRIESYWTYELCHGKYIKQYHENRELGPQKPKIQEYYLGKLEEESKSTGDSVPDSTDPKQGTDSEPPRKSKPEQEMRTDEVEIKSLKIDGLDLPYYPVEMDGGSECDLTGEPRKSHVMYICQPNGRGEIYQLKETSSCEYDIIVLTSVLCSHPAFKPKDPVVSKISCHAAVGSPSQPKKLTSLMKEQGIVLESEEDAEEDYEDLEITVTPAPPKKTTTPTPDTTIGIQADKSLLREFLTGDYCIHGGGGWWKHEFCYNSYAKQYHEDNTGTTSIFLGHWDRAKHIEWLNKNPTKKPKAGKLRKHISLFYSDGDICDLTGKPRSVEVKVKCLKGSNQPHAVSIYLVEPEPCQYTLGVESPLFCDILDKADEYGLLDNIKI